ncbi:MAG: putative exported protein [Candidatus Solibacter sp.]|jgi:hypothetical protein|nr:putative exported protein [Candidatus Solibacter sp.]
MFRTFLGLIAAGALSAQPHVELEGRYWFSQVNSKIRVEKQGLGTDIDVKNDLGFTDSDFPEGRAAVRWGHSRLSFDYTPIDFSGDRVVSRTLVFNGRTYSFGTQVISDLEAKHLQLGWTYQFHLLGGRVKLGPMVEAHGFLLSGSLRAPAVNVESKEDLSVGLPTVGPSLEISPHRRIDVYGEASGMSAGDYGHFIRSEAGVRFRPLRFVQFTAGYRTFNLRVANSPDFAHLHLRGPFVGGGFRW